MTELMKRYEAETSSNKCIGVRDYYTGYIAWLEAQLTWRPVSKGLPKEAGLYFVEAKPYTGCESTIITTAYFDGESFLWHAVVRWLPIPPAPEGEVKC